MLVDESFASQRILVTKVFLFVDFFVVSKSDDARKLGNNEFSKLARCFGSGTRCLAGSFVGSVLVLWFEQRFSNCFFCLIRAMANADASVAVAESP